MNAARELDWRSLPLTGTSLIEASAGTGKTYNIALIYLRLVLERSLSARQILVTTFTDAAAQELRARIRQRLKDAERWVAGELGAGADLTAYLADRCAVAGTQAVQARLRLALAEIDLAPISTIHGYCGRVLREYPFDTGVPFTPGEIVNERALLRECVEDYWRAQFLRDALDPWDAAFVLPIGVDALAARVGQLLDLPESACISGDSALLRRWWQDLGTAHLSRLQALVDDVSLYARSNSALRTRLASLLAAVRSADLAAVPWTDLGSMLKPDTLRGFGRSALATPLDHHPLLGAWSALAALLERASQVIVADFALRCARFVRAELARRLQTRGQTTYAQLIAEVHDRLLGEYGAALATRLSEAWPVALIDEFQDTDARQWAIFERIYQSTGAGDRALVLIGDPKQSIYAFRGGDIHAYLAARRQLPEQRRHSIRRNFRSHPHLLAALNGIYRLAGATGFGGSAIDYVEVAPGDPGKWTLQASAKPLHLRLLHTEASNVGDRDELVLDACANDIAALLSDPAAGVAPGAIAVLIDSNRRIQQLRQRLIARGVPVVGSGRASVLDSDWALDVQLLLHALLHPNDEYAVRGALATRLLGVSADALLALAADASAWEAQLLQFGRWRRLWERRGVLAVLESLVVTHAGRLLAAADGERALTDLRHLGELLQEAASDCYGPEELFAWYLAERDLGNAGVEASREQQLRIESEARRVQLLTIHAAKGLEYPVVYVPMAWRPKHAYPQDERNSVARYHDDQHRLWLDLGSADFDAHKASERLEDLQERLRALYVALTRAEHRCVLYAFDDLPPAATPIDSGRGALDVLLGAALAAVAVAGQPPDWDRMAAAVPSLQIDRDGSAHALYQAHNGGSGQRQARVPLPEPRARFGLYSFTALVRMRPDALLDATRGAEDEAASTPAPLPLAGSDEPQHPQLLALERLKGPRFGDAMHGLLETGRAVDGIPAAWHASYALQTERIASALDQQSVVLEKGSESELLAAVAAMLDRTLDSELAAGLKLATLAPGAQRAEFEFAFVLGAARWHALHGVLDAHGYGDWWPSGNERQLLRGLMKGYVDLVFAWDGRYHVLDYKTNWLGEGRLSDYAPAALEDAMREHHYGLQALIYTVALHRYLGHRLPDYDPARQLGDSWYLFLRAVGLAPGAGIWRRRFPLALIAQLDALFEGEEAHHE